MSFHKARSVRITVLAITMMVAGAVITTSTGVEIFRNCQNESDVLLPAAEKCWNDTSPVGNVISKVVKEGQFLGTIYIPAIGKKVNIFQGTTAEVLARGVGHYTHSVMPGYKDNSVFAGHRDTVFSNLGKVKMGAFILITTKNGTFIYKVNRIRIVDKKDRTVIVPTPSATLTLSTCYPFRYIGNAPKRYIIQAKLIPPDAEPIKL